MAKEIKEAFRTIDKSWRHSYWTCSTFEQNSFLHNSSHAIFTAHIHYTSIYTSYIKRYMWLAATLCRSAANDINIKRLQRCHFQIWINQLICYIPYSWCSEYKLVLSKKCGSDAQKWGIWIQYQTHKTEIYTHKHTHLHLYRRILSKAINAWALRFEVSAPILFLYAGGTVAKKRSCCSISGMRHALCAVARAVEGEIK
jgi:hypothetical protein